MTKLEKTAYDPLGRALLEICYDGTDYSGWQIQPRHQTVQAVMEKTLSKLYAGQRIRLIGSSRTDAGVHAIGFAASFLRPQRPRIELKQLQQALNKLLPESIRIMNIKEAPLNFNARYDAKGKAYTYVLNLGPEMPFAARYSWRLRQTVDVGRMRQAADYLVGTHDFSSFVVERHKLKNAVRTIHGIQFKQFGNYLCITFVGNGFLYKMIRCFIGALEAVGKGALEPGDIKKILAAKNRSEAPETGPPQGLFLMKVFYDENSVKEFEISSLPFIL